MPVSLALTAALLLARPASPRPAAAPAAASAAPPAYTLRRELGGYLLGQYASAVRSTLGEPSDTIGQEEAAPSLLYTLAPGNATYMVFSTVGEGAAARLTSVQLTGEDLPKLPAFYGVRLGDARAKVEREFGKPTGEQPVPDVKATYAAYDGANYSFEYTPGGTLYSIRISVAEGYFAAPAKAKPSYPDLRRAILARDVDRTVDALCADVEVYGSDGRTLQFDGPMREILAQKGSPLREAIFETLRTAMDAAPTNPTIRESALEERQGKFPVVELPKGSAVEKIVWRPEAGAYRVWEIYLAPKS